MEDESQPRVADIVARIASVVRAAGRPVPLHEPEFDGREWTYVRECLDSGQVSSTGPFVIRFEEHLARVVGARHAVATVNGTAALHAAMILAGVRAGDEVLVPALSFVAAANAARYCGAIPHFVDTDPATLGLDAPKLARHLARIATASGDHCVNRETGRRIAALVVLHAFGHPVDLDEVVAVSDRFAFPLLEDAAQALGSRYDGRHVGTFGRTGVFSFNGNKILTTGGGGAIVTNDSSLAEEAMHLTTTGRVPHRWTVSHDRVAYNYRMPSINAALGCAQLEQLPARLRVKRQLAVRYVAAFGGLPDCRIFTEPVAARSNYWLNVLLLEGNSRSWRDAVLTGTHRAGILTRPAWTPMHLLPPFTGCPRMDLAGAERLFSRIVTLPSSAELARDSQRETTGTPAAAVEPAGLGGSP